MGTGREQEFQAECPILENRLADDSDDVVGEALDALAELLVKDMLRLRREYGLTPVQAMEYYLGRRGLPEAAA